MHCVAAQAAQHQLGVQGELFQRCFQFFGRRLELHCAFAKRLHLFR